MNADEIVKALRYMDKPDMAYGYDGAYRWTTERIGLNAADLIESLQAQLAESQRRERAALVLYNGRNPDRTMRCSCPACGRLFQEESFVENYCPNCGQRLGRGPQDEKGAAEHEEK